MSMKSVQLVCKLYTMGRIWEEVIYILKWKNEWVINCESGYSDNDEFHA